VSTKRRNRNWKKGKKERLLTLGEEKKPNPLFGKAKEEPAFFS